MAIVDMSAVRVIAPNFKRRLSGVTSTIIQLIPIQNRLGQKVATLGPGLPGSLPRLRYRDLWRLWQQAPGGGPRIWHARRNIEMLPAILLRDLLRMKIRIVFTSASQRRHTGWSKFLIRRMDKVIATSGKTAAYLDVANSVILHGIDTRRFRPPIDKAEAKRTLGLDPSKKYTGCFGRVRHQKGTDLFVDSMIALLPSRPDWCAIVAGRATGPHLAFETELKERVAKAGLADRLHFVGEHTNIPDWYRALDLFIAPQRWEGFGLTPLEAMATGVPVVATDVGAFSELITDGPEETGVIIPAADLKAMVDGAAAFMDDEARSAAAGRRGLTRAASVFSIEGEAERLGDIYAAARMA